jgi:membrane protein YqaA with SNARE-associated domain
MDIIESYSFLFTDSWLSSLIIPPHREYVFDVMNIFGGYNTLYMIIVATLGGIAGVTCDWFLGRMFRTIQITDSLISNSKNYNIIEKFLQQFWPLPLILSFLPFGCIIPVSYGVYRISLYKMLPILFFLRIVMLYYRLS